MHIALNHLLISTCALRESIECAIDMKIFDTFLKPSLIIEIYNRREKIFEELFTQMYRKYLTCLKLTYKFI